MNTSAIITNLKHRNKTEISKDEEKPNSAKKSVTIKLSDFCEEKDYGDIINHSYKCLSSHDLNDIDAQITLAPQSDHTIRGIVDTKHNTMLVDGITHIPHLIKICVDEINKQHKCNHSFKRVKDVFGNDIPNGRAECIHCKVVHPALRPISNINHIDWAIGLPDGGYVCDMFWGEDCHIQGGNSGVVLGRKSSYTTAFFEAFPKIDGDTAFIRGEGDNIKDAEKEAWIKYQNRLKCREHEWSRVVNGIERKDGYAICVHCNLTGTKLPPLTTCKIEQCETPTANIDYSSKDSHDNFICDKHYFDRGFKPIHSDYSYNMRNNNLEHEVSFLINKAFYENLTSKELKASKDQIESIASTIGKVSIIASFGSVKISEKLPSLTRHEIDFIAKHAISSALAIYEDQSLQEQVIEEFSTKLMPIKKTR